MNSKKILSLILSGIILSASFTGCSENTADTESSTPSSSESETTAETEDPNYIHDSLEEANFDGYKFRILSDHSGGMYITAEEVNGESVNDTLYASNMTVSDRFNVSITVLEDMGGYEETVKNTAMAEDNAFDIAIGHDFTTFGLGVQGYLYNIYDVPQYDFDMPWWTDDALKNLTIQGKLFGVSNYMSYAGLNQTRAMFINKEIAEEHNIVIPYDVVREGNWTYDTMGTYLSDIAKDLDGDGKMTENDRYAFSSGYEAWYCMQEAVGVSAYHHDKDGNLYVEVDQEHMVKFVEKLQAISTKTDWYYGDTSMGQDIFHKGKSLFCYCDIGYARETFVNGETIYGFLPTPKLDDLQNDYLNCCTDKPWAISVSVDDERINIIGTITEAMSCYNYNKVIPAYFEGAMKARMADSPDDSEMLQIIRDTRTIGFAYAYKMEIANIFNSLKDSNRVASYVAKYQKVAERKLNDLIDAIEELP